MQIPTFLKFDIKPAEDSSKKDEKNNSAKSRIDVKTSAVTMYNGLSATEIPIAPEKSDYSSLDSLVSNSPPRIIADDKNPLNNYGSIPKENEPIAPLVPVQHPHYLK